MLVRLAWPGASPAPSLTAFGWTVAAVVSVGSALRLAVFFDWQTDLWEVQGWLSAWAAGLNPYQAIPTLDYPPHAFGVIWLLNLGSRPGMMAVYAVVNAALAVLACVLLVRWFAQLRSIVLSRSELVAFAGMLLASRAMRRAIMFGQTAPLVIILFVLAMQLSKRRPVLAGVLFGLASFKLNLAVGFGLGLILLGEWRPLLVAAGVVAGLTAAFAWSIQSPVVDVLSSYVHNLSTMYLGAEFVPGVTGLRTGLVALVSDAQLAQLIYLPLVGLTLGSLITLSLVRRPGAPADRGMTILACVLWSFISLPHQLYNTVLLFPALWMMRTRSVQSRILRWFLSIAFLWDLIVSVPDVFERWVWRQSIVLPGSLRSLAATAIDVADAHATRIIVSVAFVLVLRQLLLVPPSGPAPHVPTFKLHDAGS